MNTNSSLYGKNIALNDISTKRKLLEYLYQNVPIANYYLNYINDKKTMTFLQEAMQNNVKYYIEPLYSGIKSLLLFKKIGDIYYSISINKSFIKKKLEYVDLNTVILFPVNIKAHSNIYNGTIFDGVYDKKNSTFIINDIYYLEGNNLQNHKINNKFINLKEYIQSQIEYNNIQNVMYIKLNEIYQLDQLDKFLNQTKNNISICGLLFVPEIYVSYTEYSISSINGHANEEDDIINNYIYCYNLDDDDYKYINNNSKNNMNDNKNKGKNIFIMEKSVITDVYKLYDVKNDKNAIGIAYVPNAKYSHMYKDWFKNTNKIKVICEFNKKFNKWMPLNNI
jgi:hypothetical protein